MNQDSAPPPARRRRPPGDVGCREGFGSVAFVALPGDGLVPADAAREVWASALCAQVDPDPIDRTRAIPRLQRRRCARRVR